MSRKKLTSKETFPGLTDRLREVRGKQNQEDFGRMVGVSKPMVSKYESGKAVPSAETLKKIADYGGVTVEWLLRGEELEAVWPKFRLKSQEHAPEIYDAGPLTPLSETLLTEVLAAVDDYLAAHRLKRRAIQKARLIMKVYNHCAESKDRPGDLLVARYLPLAD